MLPEAQDDKVIKVQPAEHPEALSEEEIPRGKRRVRLIWCVLFCILTVAAVPVFLWLSCCATPKDPEGCDSGASFSRDVDSAGDLGPFSYIIASDTQFPWIDLQQDAAERCASARIQPYSKACTKWYGRYTNGLQLSSMLSLIRGEKVLVWPKDAPRMNTSAGDKVTRPRDVVINGDLTAYYHQDEANDFAATYHSMEFNLFPGLGNHDYTNNVAKCFRSTLDGNCCAKQAISYMRQGVACGTTPNFEASKVSSYDAASMAYSWNVGKYHFVQLQYHPFYENAELGIKPSIGWLAGDLQKAYERDQYTVIFAHVVFNNQATVEVFGNVTRGRNVVAIFHGHRHDFFGNLDEGANGHLYPHDIPVFFSGSSGYKVFLLAEFRNDSYSVGVVNSSSGIPVYAPYTRLSDQKNMVSYTL